MQANLPSVEDQELFLQRVDAVSLAVGAAEAEHAGLVLLGESLLAEISGGD